MVVTDDILLKFSDVVYSADFISGMPSGWELVKPVAGSGLNAAMYRNISTNEVIISFRGTEFGKDNMDIVGDIFTAGGVASFEHVRGYEFYKECIVDIENNDSVYGSNPDIYITGHSLGGGIAQYVTHMAEKDGYESNINITSTVTFNPAGIQNIVGEDAIGSSKIVNYIVDTDPVSAALPSIGFNKYIDAPLVTGSGDPLFTIGDPSNMNVKEKSLALLDYMFFNSHLIPALDGKLATAKTDISNQRELNELFWVSAKDATIDFLKGVITAEQFAVIAATFIATSGTTGIVFGYSDSWLDFNYHISENLNRAKEVLLKCIDDNKVCKIFVGDIEIYMKNNNSGLDFIINSNESVYDIFNSQSINELTKTFLNSTKYNHMDIYLGNDQLFYNDHSTFVREYDLDKSGEYKHLFAKGESLYEIANRRGFTVDELLEVNKFLETSDRVSAGGDFILVKSGEAISFPTTGNDNDNVLVGSKFIENTLIGNGGDDLIIGGSRVDNVTGGEGSDTLIGGLGIDNYYFNTTDFATDVKDTIIDGDGKGYIYVDGNQISSLFTTVSINVWENNDGYVLTYDSNTKEATLSHKSNTDLNIIISDFKSGDVGISLDYTDDYPSNEFSPPTGPYNNVGYDDGLEFASPLALDLNGDGVISSLGYDDSSTFFDIDGDGAIEKVGWVRPTEGLLAYDADGNGTIDNVSELFGYQDLIDGFSELKVKIDSNNDNIIDNNDDLFSELKIWQDVNMDGISQEEELSSLADNGIESINLDSVQTYENSSGNIIKYVSEYTKTNGETGVIGDIFFQTSGSVISSDLPDNLPDEIYSFPLLRGWGRVSHNYNAYLDNNDFVSYTNDVLASSSLEELWNKFDGYLARWSGLKEYCEGYGYTYDDTSLTIGQKMWILEEFVDGTRNHFWLNYAISEPDTFQKDKPDHSDYICDEYYALKTSVFLQFAGQSLLKNSFKGMEYKLTTNTFAIYDVDSFVASANNLLDSVENINDLLNYAVALNYFVGDKQIASIETVTESFADKIITLLPNTDYKISCLFGEYNYKYSDGRTLTILNSETRTEDTIESLRLTGTQYWGDDNSNIVLGSDSADLISGNGGNDILSGGNGNDFLSGGAGSDTFIINKNTGVDTIQDYANSGDNNIVVFSSGISHDSISLGLDSTNLVFNIDGQSLCSISNYFNASDVPPIDEFQFSDGTIWTYSDVKVMLEASGYVFTMGSNADDTYNLTSNNDLVFAKNGLNTVYAGAGNDQIYSGTGNDYIDGGAGNDYIDGGDGDDFLIAGSGNDTLSGGSGNDKLYTNSGNDYLYGGLGDDEFHITSLDSDITISDFSHSDPESNKIIFSSNFNKDDMSITSTDGSDLVIKFNGIAGSITIQSQFSTNSINEFAFDDGTVLTFENIYNQMNFTGTDGEDYIKGTYLDDTITGAGDDDYLYGLNGNDYIDGGLGSDYIDSGAGNDTVIAGAGDDEIHSGDGNDLINAGTGNDYVKDFRGDDQYIFNLGDNTLLIEDTDGNDSINFGSGISLTDLSFQHVGKNLKILINDTDSIQIFDYFDPTKPENKIETIIFDDATTINITDYLSGIMDEAILGNDSGNIINGTSGNDLVFSGGGDDEIYGGENIDSIYAGSGDDLVYGGSGNDYIVGDDGNDVVWGGEGTDIITGNDGNDILTGESGDDFIYGGDGNDELRGSEGTDYLVGGMGNDTYHFEIGMGNDIAAEQVIPYSQKLLAEYQYAFERDYSIDDIANELFAMLGNSLDLQGGDDKVFFQAGITLDDILFIKEGDNLLIKHKTSGDSLKINCFFERIGEERSVWRIVESFVFADGTILTSEDIDSIAQILGTDSDDSISGSWLNDTIYGLDGNDTIGAGKGDDTIYGGDGDDVIKTWQGDDTVYAGAGNDTVEAYSGNNTITGGAGDDLIKSGADADTYIYNLGDGNDIIKWSNLDDKLVLGAGIKTSDVQIIGNGTDLQIKIIPTNEVITIDAQFMPDNDGLGKVIFDDGTEWTADQLKNITVNGSDLDDITDGSYANDTIYGGLGNDELSGGIGEDTLYGGAGDDTLVGGAGEDTLYGGAGNDLLRGEELNEAASVSYMYGEDGDDTIYSSNYGAIIDGGFGNDTIYGNDGLDFFNFVDGFGQDTIFKTDSTNPSSTAIGNDIINFTGSITESDLLFSVSGTSWNSLDIKVKGTTDVIRYTAFFANPDQSPINQINFSDGSSLNIASIYNRLGQYGTDSDGAIMASDYSEEIYGYGGNDTLNGEGGNDTVYGGLGNDALHGGDGHDTLYGGTGDDTLYGDAGNDTFVYNLGDGNDTIRDAEITDVIKITGVNKDDVTFSGDNVNLVMHFTDGGSLTIENFYHANTPRTFNVVVFDDGSYITPSELQTLVINGTDLDDTIDGSDAPEEINALGGNDTVTAGKADDTVYGGDGNDTISGNEGADTLYGGDGDDKLYGNSGTSGYGNEDDYLDGGAGNDYLYGNAGNDTLIGGDGVDRLYANAGDNSLDGGTGNDYLYGDTGNDAFVFNAGWGVDVIYKDNYWFTKTGGGSDKISFGEGIVVNDLRFSKNGEDLVISHANGVDKIIVKSHYYDSAPALVNIEFSDGSTLDNTAIDSLLAIHGTSGSDTLNGTSVDDKIIGYSGNDTLIGGDGDDTYLYSIGDGDDIIVDNQGTNKIQLDFVPTDFKYTQDGDDLLIEFDGQTGSIKVTNWFIDDNAKLDIVGLDRSILATSSQIDDSFNITIEKVIDELIIDKELVEGTDSYDYIMDYKSVDSAVLANDGNDYIRDYGGNDVYVAGTGNDRLIDYRGNDIYVFSRGDGQDIIYDRGYPDSSFDKIVLGEDISSDDIVFSRKRYDLVISLKNSSDSITVSGWFYSSRYKIETIEFLDGTTISSDYIDQNTPITGTEGSDRLYGTNGDDVIVALGGNDKIYSYKGNDDITAGTGNDYIKDYGGSDTYRFNRGDGKDFIYDRKYYSTDTDKIVFGTGLNVEDLLVSKSGNDLVLKFAGTEDQITIDNWYMSNYYKIEAFEFADGRSLGFLDIESMVQLMGTEGSDRLYGTYGNDKIFALGGHDRIYDYRGDDWFEGGKGNDYIRDYSGNDTIKFNIGDGYDTVYNRNGNDKVVFGAGITKSDISCYRSGYDMYMNIGATDKIRFVYWYRNAAYQIESFEFADGNFLNANEIMNLSEIHGTNGSDYIKGTDQSDKIMLFSGDDRVEDYAGDDKIIAGKGNDKIINIDGNDIYEFSTGDGNDYLYDKGTISDENDTVRFTTDVDRNKIALFMDNRDLLIGYGTDDSILVRYNFDDNIGVEKIEHNGSYISTDDINRIVQEIAAFGQDNGLDLDSLDDVSSNQSLMDIVYSGWQDM